MNHFNASKAFLKQNKLLEALEAINTCLEIEPENADAISQRGVTYFHMRKRSLALLDFDKALQLEPSNPYRYSSRAYIRAAYKDINGAEEDYLKAIELDPDDEIALNNYGLLMESRGRLKEAKKYFDASDAISGVELMPENLQQKINAERKLEEEKQQRPSNWTIIRSVFSNKGALREFLQFVKNGFKNTQ